MHRTSARPRLRTLRFSPGPRSAVAAAALLALLPVGVQAATTHAPRSCAASARSGGDWPSYDGPDTRGARRQGGEHVIGPGNVGNLQVAWSTAGVDTGQGTPVVAGDCVYVVGADGKAAAFHLSDGRLMWKVVAAPRYPKKHYAFAPAVANGRLYFSLGDGLQAQNPDADVVAVALDGNTGQHDYVSKRIRWRYPNNAGASAVVFDGMQLVMTTGPDGDPHARPGYAILDARTGRVLHSQTTIPPKLMKKGYAGGGIWATPVVDPASKYAFVGTANPYSKFKGSIYDDAILKIDVDRARRTFGRIVDVYRGSVDQWAEGIDQQPACDMFGDSIGTPPDAYSLTCFQFDIDFGGSPGLFRDSAGRLMIGEMQKSAEFHAVYADTMTRAWKVSLGPPIPPGTAGPLDAPAFDGKHVFIAGAGTMFALNPDDGSIAWATPIPDLAQTPVPGKPAQVANGVVYYSEGSVVDAFDAATGSVLWTSATADANAQVNCRTSANSGLAIAHHLLIKNCATQLVAYRLPGGAQ